MLKIAVCDDNPIQCAQIRDMTVSNLQLPAEITTFTSASDFLDHISEDKSHFHIVLMDIDLGTESLSGIALAEKINLLSPETQIIFISQHLQYASSVYETNHVYFICKQQLAEYLPKALTAACRKLHDLQNRYLCFSYLSRDYRLLRSDILYLERKLRNTEIHTKNHLYFCREKLPALVAKLHPDFCVCHKSFAVNLQLIHTFSHAGIELSDGTHIPVSRSCYQPTKDAFARLLLNGQEDII